jgi:hypothetical protein
MVHNLFVVIPASGKRARNFAVCVKMRLGGVSRSVEILTLVRHSTGMGSDKIDLLNIPLR